MIVYGVYIEGRREDWEKYSNLSKLFVKEASAKAHVNDLVLLEKIEIFKALKMDEFVGRYFNEHPQPNLTAGTRKKVHEWREEYEPAFWEKLEQWKSDFKTARDAFAKSDAFIPTGEDLKSIEPKKIFVIKTIEVFE